MIKRSDHTLGLMSAVAILILMLLAFGCKSAPQPITGSRYVVLSPEIAEIIALLEGTDNIVGITEECNFPREYSGKTVVGKFGTLDKERIIALKPSIVFASSLEQQAIASELSKLGIKVISVYPQTISQMIEGIVTIGNSIGQGKRGVTVADSLQKVLAEIRTKSGTYSSQALHNDAFQTDLHPALQRGDSGQNKGNGGSDTRLKVYLEIYREPLMSVSDQSFVGELIELAGADNIFDTLERDYCRIKAEDVIAARPDIIICYSQDNLQNIKKRMGWQDIPAVKNNRVYFEKDINPDWLLRAGPRCVLGAARIQELLQNVDK